MQVTITSDAGHRFSFGYDPNPYAVCLLYALAAYTLCAIVINLINLVRILWSDPK